MMWTRLTIVAFLCTSLASRSLGGYVAILPKVLYPGESNYISVSVSNVNKPVAVVATLFDNQNSLATASGTVSSGTMGTLNLVIPAMATSVNLSLTVTGSGGMQFINSSNNVQFSMKTMSVFVQTDKAQYKPSDIVLFRVFATYPTLLPSLNPISVSILDPNDNTMRKWSNVDVHASQGVFSNNFTLSDQPVQGFWTIHVDAGAASKDLMFNVTEYVLPKFEVSVITPSFFMVASGNLMLSVQAKYTYGKPVGGTAAISLMLSSYQYAYACQIYDYQTFTYRQNPCPTLTAKAALDSNGVAKFQFTRQQLNSLVFNYNYLYSSTFDPESTLNYSTIAVSANVTESLTGITLAGSGSVSVTSNKYTMKFLSMTPTTYKANLPFNGNLQISQTDGSTPDLNDFKNSDGSEIKIQINFTLQYSYNISSSNYPQYDQVVTTQYYSVPASGIVQFSFSLNAAASSLSSKDGVVLNSLSIGANIQPEMCTIPVAAYASAQRFISESGSGIQISILNSNATVQPGDTANFALTTSTSLKNGFSYQLLSKGMIVLSASVAGPVSGTYKFSVPITSTLAQQLAPSGRIIAWTVLSSPMELLADSVDFNVNGAFANNVTIAFSTDQTEPGQKVTVMVGATPGSFVAISAVDKSVLLLGGSNDITQSLILADLATYGSVSYNNYPPFFGGGGGIRGMGGPVNDMMICFDCWWPRPIAGTTTSEVLNNAGVIALTDAFIETATQVWYPLGGIEGGVNGGGNVFLPAAGGPVATTAGTATGSKSDSSLQPVQTIRQNFAESWLWLNEIAGSDGKVTKEVTLPDTITSWVANSFGVSSTMGLGVAPAPAMVTGFKPFFVSLNLPYSVVRGETFKLTITLFNYLAATEQVQLTVVQSPDFMISQTSTPTTSQTLTVPVSVNSMAGADVIVWIKPTSIGNVMIEVTAQSSDASDAIEQSLLVKPEGVPSVYSTSRFIDLTTTTMYSSTVGLSYPSDVVPGSQIVTVSAFGDLMSPSVSGLSMLIQLPTGCGEQTMIGLAPDVSIMNYLTKKNLLTPALSSELVSDMNEGYQRELTYQHKDSSFSAFGDTDSSGSVWLTAFVVETFVEASTLIDVDPTIVANAATWLVGKLNSNGSFTEVGQVIHTDMQGGASHGIPLTAFVLLSLLSVEQSGVTSVTGIASAIQSAQAYLEKNWNSISNDAYSLAIVTYALAVAGSQQESAAMTALMALAKTADGLTYWQSNNPTTTISAGMFAPPYPQPPASDLELNCYVLLTFAVQKDVSQIIPLVKWVTQKRNANGGFAATQDTVVCLKALSMSGLLLTPPNAFDVTVQVSNGTVSHTFDQINANSAIVTQTYEYHSAVSTLTITATGQGVAYVQVAVNYNEANGQSQPLIVLQATPSQPTSTSIAVHVCTRWTADYPSGMGLITVQAPSGAEFDTTDTTSVINQLNGTAKLQEYVNDTMNIYVDQFDKTQFCFTASMLQVVPVENQKPSAVQATPYYNPSAASIVLFGGSGDSPIGSTPQPVNSKSPLMQKLCSVAKTIKQQPALYRVLLYIVNMILNYC